MTASRSLYDPKTWDEDIQRVLNAHSVPAKEAQHGAPSATNIPVVARVQWEHDGEEYVFAVAKDWTTDRILVRVVLNDSRAMPRGIWLVSHDIYKTPPT